MILLGLIFNHQQWKKLSSYVNGNKLVAAVAAMFATASAALLSFRRNVESMFAPRAAYAFA